jgi:hypothetical protein
MAHPSTRQGTAGNDAIPITDDADLEEAVANLTTQIPARTNLRRLQPPTMQPASEGESDGQRPGPRRGGSRSRTRNLA